MTLSRFLRDYLYITLGGNRKGPARRYVNLFLTMLLGGLWHGAGWNFVLWGGLHGAYLCANHGWRRIRSSRPARPLPARVVAPVTTALTFLAVAVSWVFFRAESLDGAMALLTAMFRLPDPGFASMVVRGDAALWIGGLFLVALFCPNSQRLVAGAGPPPIEGAPAFSEDAIPELPMRWSPNPWWAAALAAIAFASLMVLSSGKVSEFIYYQF